MESEYMLREAESELARHHRDFNRISNLLDKMFLEHGSEIACLMGQDFYDDLLKIRNIVG